MAEVSSQTVDPAVADPAAGIAEPGGFAVSAAPGQVAGGGRVQRLLAAIRTGRPSVVFLYSLLSGIVVS
ncbi:MAG TPA: hypothetical protein VMD59_03760, partial [Acidimicrobiales bacterium]|nr:hypothetical protein [Acidimicrobiales bacterium]